MFFTFSLFFLNFEENNNIILLFLKTFFSLINLHCSGSQVNNLVCKASTSESWSFHDMWWLRILKSLEIVSAVSIHFNVISFWFYDKKTIVKNPQHFNLFRAHFQVQVKNVKVISKNMFVTVKNSFKNTMITEKQYKYVTWVIK